MRRLSVFLLFLTLTQLSLAESSWYSRVLDLQSSQNEIRGFGRDGSNDYSFTVNYPYERTVPAFKKLLAINSLKAHFIDRNYSVFSTHWKEWVYGPEARKYDWLLGARSSTHVILLRQEELTKVLIREEIQIKTVKSKDWVPGPTGHKGDAKLEQLVAASILYLRYSADEKIARTIIDDFQADSRLGVSDDYQLPDAQLNPLAEIDAPLREPDEEIGMLKRLYWFGSISLKEYVLLEQKVPQH